MNDGGGPFAFPTTPASLSTRFNALGSGNTGATRRLHYIEGVNAIVLPNGDAGLPSPGTNSPTGFWCKQLENCLNPGDGNHFRPTVGINGNNGAPCSAAGIIQGMGLELPPVVMDAIMALAHREHNGKPGAVLPDIDSTIPGTGGLYAVLSDRSAGVTIGGIGKLRAGTQMLRYGANGDPNQVLFDSDEIGNWEALRQVPALFSTWASFGVGTPILPWSKWFTTGPANVSANFAISRFSRDLIHDDVANIYTNKSGDPMATGRTLRWIVDNGNVGNADTSQYELYIDTGRANAAQQKLMCDWTIARYPTAWEDTRTRIGFWFGDSFQSPYQAWQNATILTQGGHNLPAIPSFALSVFARSGNNVDTYQFPFLYFLQDCDFSLRTRVAILWGEWINENLTVATELIRNYKGLDVAVAIDAKVRACIHNLAWCNSSQQATYDPGVENDLNANAVSVHGAQFVLNMLHNQFYNAYNFGGGTGPTQKPVLWNGSDGHPSAQGEAYQDAMYQDAFLRLLGDDVSNKTEKVDCSVDSVNLSAGSPTATPTWSPKRYDGAATTGKTITFGTYKLIGGVATLDNTVATVNASTGVITRVAAGECYVLATCDDGALGVCGVICT